MAPHRKALTLALALIALAPACKDEGDEPPPPPRDERTIVTIQSYVYAAPSEPKLDVVHRVLDQIKSATGALKSMRVTGSNKDVANDIEPKLYSEPLVLVRPGQRDGVILRVWYRYSDQVIAPAGTPRGVPVLVGGLHRQTDDRFTQIVTACTANTRRELEMRGRLQGVFNGSLAACQKAMVDEQSIIDAARVRLDAPDEEVVLEEIERTYIPVVARLYGLKPSALAYPRFEDVAPQPGRASSSSVAERGEAAPARAGDDRPDDGAEGPARSAGPDAPIIIPGGGAAEPGGRRGPSTEDEPSDPNTPAPIAVAAEPIVVAAGPPKVPQPVQPRGEGGSSFNWEDLMDKRFLVLWIAVFALYPLLRARKG